MKKYNKLQHNMKYLRMRVLQFLSNARCPEIRTKDFFGRTLQRIVRYYKPKSILEIGSWDGRGSTTCLLSKLDYKPDFLRCVEVFSERANVIEKQIVPSFPFVEVHNCSTINYDDWSFKNFDDDLWNPLSENAKKSLDRDEILGFWRRESTILKSAQQDYTYFDKFPDQYYDMVLIDGGECTGFDEYRLLRKRFNIICKH